MNKQLLRYDHNCRICGSDKITTVFKLIDTPLEDQFVSSDNLKTSQPTYPLELAICEECGYVHLPYIVSPQASYEDYSYESGVTVGLRTHYDQYAKDLVTEFGVIKGSLVIDLGSNDGSMLSSFKQLGMSILGIEPAGKIANQANAAGLPTINAFFNKQVADKVIKSHGFARVVTANYMFANVDDIIGFTKAVFSLLAPDGVFVVQTGYHPSQMKIGMFDYIYHEHFSYFTLAVMKSLFLKCGLEVIHVQKTTPKGGSIRVVAQLIGGNRKVDPSVSQMIDEENSEAMYDPETYRKFARHIDESKHRLLFFLGELRSKGKRVVGFGASHSTTTLIYHFELEPFIEYLVDDNPIKQGLFSPGYHIPVYAAQKIYQDKPDYILILGWQHQESIMNRHKDYFIQNGHWIIPLPQLLSL